MSKCVVVTGGSRGIGKSTIAHFYQQGWQTINISRTPCDLPGVTNVEIDLSSSQHIDANIQRLQSVMKEFSQIALVHNAAYYQADSVDSITMAGVRQTLEVNVVSTMALNSFFIPLMLPQSSIIYIGSTLSTKAVPGSASYIVSKHALIGLMKATCQDLRKQQIHTCCICPGLVDTDLLRIAVEENVIKDILANQVLGQRLIKPQEIAELVYFCAMNPTINGATIHANLGQGGE